MKMRRRFRQTASFKDRLAAFAEEAREKAKLMEVGAEREDLLQRASRTDTAAHIDEWASSPGLQPPK